MDEPKFQPLFLYSDSQNGLETGPAAEFMVRPGLTVDRAARQIRHFAQAPWIFPCGHRGPANLWNWGAIGAALALGALSDSGISDRDVMLHASIALHYWQPEQSEKQPNRIQHPILTALRDIASGERIWWYLDVRILRGSLTGRTQIRAWCYDDRYPPEFPSIDPADPWIPEARHLVILNPVLLPFVNRVCEQARIKSLN